MSKFLHLFLLSLGLSLASIRPSWADTPTENQIKSAYVLNFIKFVDWPAGAGDARVALCVMGNAPLGGALSSLDGRKAGAREIHVEHVKYDDDLKGCQVLYIGESEQRRVTAIIRALADSPVLTISDIENFAQRGGTIGLVSHENRIVFEVNLASARSGKLFLSGQMLNLATHVFGR